MNDRQQRYYDLLVIQAHRRGYQVIGEYVDTHTRIAMQCPQGHEMQMCAANFKSGQSCARCVGTCRIQAREEFQAAAIRRGYQVLGEYRNAQTPIRVRCSQGHECQISPNSFKSGNGCARCAGTCQIQAREEFQAAAIRRGYQISGEYVNTRTKVEMRCPQDHIIWMVPINFKRGNGCLKCSGRCPVQAREEFQALAQQRGYQILGEYVNTDTKIEIRCPQKHEVQISPDNFKSGKGCARCAGKCPVQAREDFQVSAVQRGYQIIGDYVDTKTPIGMKCPQEHIIGISPSNFKSRKGCVKCARKCSIQAELELHALAAQRGYEVLGQYVNTRDRIRMQCPTQHVIEISADNFKKGKGCAVCSGNCSKTAQRDLYLQAEERGYQILGQYVNSGVKIPMRCPEGHFIEQRPDRFKKNQGCSICQETTGEQLIRATLNHLGLPVEGQYRIPTLRNRKCDFATIWGSRRVIIEWDGEQHFVDTGWFTDMNLEARQWIDLLKTQAVIKSRQQIIRIDHSWLNKSVQEIGEFLILAMESRQQLVVSNMRKYQWLIEDLVWDRPRLKIREPAPRVDGSTVKPAPGSG